MLDIANLERRWLKYKIKSFAPAIGAASAVIMIGIAAAYWLSSHSEPAPSVVKKAPVAEKTAVPDPKPVTVETETNTTFLEPSMNFIQNFNDAVPNAAEQLTQNTQPAPKPVRQTPIVPAAVPPTTVLTVPEAPVPQAETKTVPNQTGTTSKSLSINRSETKLDIDELQRRFKETSNPNLGLFITRYYYDRGNFAESYNYALKTNAINSKIDENWILFCKSLVKLGKTDQAKKTLQVYISQSNSDAAKELLASIEKGSFR